MQKTLEGGFDVKNKTVDELCSELGKLRWYVVSFFFVCSVGAFQAGKYYGEQGKAGELTVYQAQLQRQQTLLLECRNIAGDTLQKSIDAEMRLKEVRK